MIIVEGCDNSGKTTLATRLAQDLKLTYVNNRKRPTDPEGVFVYTALMVSLDRVQPIIHDRWQCISEPIYGPICRNTRILSLDQIETCLEITAPAQIIYCRPPTDQILEFGAREQMEGVVDNAVKLINGYDAMMKNLVTRYCPVFEYDFTLPDSYSQLLDYLK